MPHEKTLVRGLHPKDTQKALGLLLFVASLILSLSACSAAPAELEPEVHPSNSDATQQDHAQVVLPDPDEQIAFGDALSMAALTRLDHRVRYDGSYHTIPYPMGDVPDEIGVCTDVVIRSYRLIGIDLQQLVHEDMQRAFNEYPRLWGLTKPDPNIDHRRVPNLEMFFERHGQSLSLSNDPTDYRPGDLVTWRLPGNLPHIGIVVDKRSPANGNPLIVHNIGRGPQLEDILFKFEMTGHFRYEPDPPKR